MRRVGGACIGVDHSEQPEYVARFGSEMFVLTDALDRERPEQRAPIIYSPRPATAAA